MRVTSSRRAGSTARMLTTMRAERPGGHTVDIGAEHRHGGVVLDMPQRNARLHQRVLEGERTAQGEGHHVIGPQIADVMRRALQPPVPVDVVGGHIAADVDIAAKRVHHRITGIRDADQRARLGVALAKAHEIERGLSGKDHDIGLKIADPEPGGMPAVAPGADLGAQAGQIGLPQTIEIFHAAPPFYGPFLHVVRGGR